MTALRNRFGDETERLPLNPDVPQPPFPVRLSLPASWSLLDINPGTWRRSAEELIDTTFRGSRLPAAERKTFLGYLEGLVADCQSAGACVSLVTVGRREGGGAASAGIHLAFGDQGVPATLGRVQDSVPRGGTRTEIDSGVGPALLQRERMTMVIPGTGELAALTSLQIFVPIPDTTWTAVLATASAYPEITDRLETLLVEIARSMRVDRPAGDVGDAGDGDARGTGDDSEGGAGDEGTRNSGAGAAGSRDRGRSGPLLSDGFGGLIPHRLGPDPNGGDRDG